MPEIKQIRNPDLKDLDFVYLDKDLFRSLILPHETQEDAVSHGIHIRISPDSPIYLALPAPDTDDRGIFLPHFLDISPELRISLRRISRIPLPIYSIHLSGSIPEGIVESELEDHLRHNLYLHVYRKDQHIQIKYKTVTLWFTVLAFDIFRVSADFDRTQTEYGTMTLRTIIYFKKI